MKTRFSQPISPVYAILIGVILVMILYSIPATEDEGAQSVIPDCFTQEDCARQPLRGYCDVEYDCIQGTCYSQDIVCPEQCNTPQDEDRDGLVGCDDPDCYDSPSCPCYAASFNECETYRCYCPEGVPGWYVQDQESWCACT